MSLHTIHLWGALRPLVGGTTSIVLEASTIRELFRKIAEEHPGMQPHIQRGIAVSIDGKIYRDQLDVALPVGAEIYLMPRVPGG